MGRTPSGQRNGFDPGSTRPCKWNHHPQRPFGRGSERRCFRQAHTVADDSELRRAQGGHHRLPARRNRWRRGHDWCVVGENCIDERLAQSEPVLSLYAAEKPVSWVALDAL